MLSIDEIIAERLTLGELAADAFPDGNYDTAKPQAWLNEVASRAIELEYQELNSTLVWLYPSRDQSRTFWLSGIPAPLCEDTARELDRQGIPYWSKRGYHGQRRV